MNPLTFELHYSVGQILIQLLTLWLVYRLIIKARLNPWLNGFLWANMVALIRRTEVMLVSEGFFRDHVTIIKYVENTTFPILFSIFSIIGVYQLIRYIDTQETIKKLKGF